MTDDASTTNRALRNVLSRDPYVIDENTRARRTSRPVDADTNVEHSDYSYGSAAQRLRSMLTAASPVQLEPKTVLFSLPRRVSLRSCYVF